MKATVLWKDKDMDTDCCLYAGEIEVNESDSQSCILDKARDYVCNTQIDIYVKMGKNNE